MILLSRLQGRGRRTYFKELGIKTTEGLENCIEALRSLHVTYFPIYPITIPVSTLMPPRSNWAASWLQNSGPLSFVLLLGHPRKLSSDPLPWAPSGIKLLPGPVPQPLLPQPTRLPWCSALPLGAGWGKLEARAGGAVLLFIAFIPLALLCWI